MKPREARREFRRDVRRRKAQALAVVHNDWVIEYAPHNARYARLLHTQQAFEAFSAYGDLEIRDGAKKRLLRNGKVVDRHTSPVPMPARHQEEVLPIAL